MILGSYDVNNQIELLNLTIRKQNSGQIVDIVSLLDQFIIYEDFFQASISARLIFRDQVNLVGTFPITGGEIVNIQYRTPIYSEAVSLDFVVYEIGERGINNSSENIQMNQLMLCTPEVWWAANNDISSAHKGTYSDIIEQLLKETSTPKSLEKEESVGIVNYVAPAWNVFRTIKFCASRANSKNSSPMFFWETPYGYQFRSLKEIYDTPHYKTLFIEDRSVAGADKDANKVFNTAYSFEYLPSNNRLQQYTIGAFGSTNYSVDFTNKRIIKTNDSYGDSVAKIAKYPLNDETKDKRNKLGYIPYRADLSHLTAFPKLSSIELMDNFRLLMNIPGDSQMKVGDIVLLDIPSKVGFEISKEAHTSGKWLMRSIKHLITKTTYSMTCELTKDSFEVDVK